MRPVPQGLVVLHEHQRRRPSHADTYEARRARELAPLIATSDLVIDLHATNKPSEAFAVAMVDTPERRELCALFTCDKLLLVPDDVIGGTTGGYAEAHGAIGLCFESGWAGDLTQVDAMRVSVEALLARVGLLDARQSVIHPQTVYALTAAILLTDRGFTFAPSRGERSFEPFSAGDLIGAHGETELRAPYDGLLMFPKVPELWKVGSPVAFLACVPAISAQGDRESLLLGHHGEGASAHAKHGDQSQR
jgi:succinylglutamate desuccinylase